MTGWERRSLAMMISKRAVFSQLSLRGGALFAPTWQSLVPKGSTDGDEGTQKRDCHAPLRGARNDRGVVCHCEEPVFWATKQSLVFGKPKREIATGLQDKPLAMTVQKNTRINYRRLLRPLRGLAMTEGRMRGASQ